MDTNDDLDALEPVLDEIPEETFFDESDLLSFVERAKRLAYREVY